MKDEYDAKRKEVHCAHEACYCRHQLHDYLYPGGGSRCAHPLEGWGSCWRGRGTRFGRCGGRGGWRRADCGGGRLIDLFLGAGAHESCVRRWEPLESGVGSGGVTCLARGSDTDGVSQGGGPGRRRAARRWSAQLRAVMQGAPEHAAPCSSRRGASAPAPRHRRCGRCASPRAPPPRLALGAAAGGRSSHLGRGARGAGPGSVAAVARRRLKG